MRSAHAFASNLLFTNQRLPRKVHEDKIDTFGPILTSNLRLKWRISWNVLEQDNKITKGFVAFSLNLTFDLSCNFLNSTRSHVML